MSEKDAKTAHILSGVAHDLRSPLNAVIGFSRLLLKGIDGPLSELQVTDVEAIQANGRTLLEMIEDLIELARIEAGCLIRSPRPFHLPPLLEKAIFVAKPTAKERQVEVTYQSSQALPLVYADEMQIEKILHRLASAAIHFVGPGSVQWTVRVVGKDIVVRTIARNQGGLSPEAPYILEGFLSAGTSPEQQIDAIALRLIISQWAIAANGGTLWVEDQTDEQISIAFSLPVSTSP